MLIVVNNFADNDIAIIICRVLFAIDMIFTYPVVAYAVRDTIEKSAFKGRPFSWFRHVAITAVIVSSTALVACWVCNLGVIMEITGGVSASIIAFVIPSAAYLRACKLKGVQVPLLSMCLHWVYIVFGCGLLVLTVVLVIAVPSKDNTCYW